MPKDILRDIVDSHDVKKILWVAIGDTPESWFYAFELKNGAVALRLGEGAPEALQEWVDQISKSSNLLKSLRVQLGNDGSFVAWTQSAWACYNVPEPLGMNLRRLSSHYRGLQGVTQGSFRTGKSYPVYSHSITYRSRR
jgi:methylenetetrahydrofolate dehydrogenase (NADP+)/methenyltetrahydrofolate cyclohydrolase/formyltetrahydrofolate synthetase